MNQGLKKRHVSLYTLVILLFVDILLVGAHIFFRSQLGFFDLDKEQSLKAVFSGFQLMGSGFLAFFLWFLFKKGAVPAIWQLVWLSLGLMFFYLAMDDMVMLHERIGFVVNHWTGMQGAFESFNWLLYFSPLIVLGFLVFIASVRSLFHIHAFSGWLSAAGLTLFTGTLFFEYIGGQLLKMGVLAAYPTFIILEESFLLLGESLFAGALMNAFAVLFARAYAFQFPSRHTFVPARLYPNGIASSPFIVCSLQWLRTMALAAVLIPLFLALASLFLPAFAVLERTFSIILPYEAIIRFGLLLAMVFALIASYVWIVAKGAFHHRFVWTVCAVSCVMLGIVFVGDTSSRLMEEYSWIRYTTFMFLISASVAACILAYHAWKARSKAATALWFVIGSGFLFGAFDEVFQLHEWIGQGVEQSTHLPHVVTDLITVGYAVVGLCVVAVALVTLFRQYRDHFFAIGVFCAGGFVYLFSTLFDTLDMVASSKIKAFVSSRVEQGFIVPDQWTLFWNPRNMFNSIEEVLEQAAATLFFAGLALILVQRRFGQSGFRFSFFAPLRVAYGIGGVAVVLCGVFLVSAPFGAKALSATENGKTDALAGPTQGLQHADDLFYHPSWGVLVGNEGAGSVLQYKDGETRTLPDSQNLLADTDSVTATDSGVYVSSGMKKTIYHYTTKEGWQVAWDSTSGLVQPEALVAVGEELYVIDESQQTIIRLRKGKQPESWRPQHPEWKSPEGITYSEKLKSFFVTDDVSGAVFKVGYKTSIEKVAQLIHPEDLAMTSKETLLITDNGAGTIIEMNTKGEIQQVIRFLRAYRDVQGIATDGTATYVVTSDGYGGGSFMPSLLFKIENKSQ
ncbi:hypothetical protein HY620_02370 [Candidatus Uhrbacteria bacterium]|nr:hypothetical protein [Candidatus Uhrbacteria bacterium]